MFTNLFAERFGVKISVKKILVSIDITCIYLIFANDFHEFFDERILIYQHDGIVKHFALYSYFFLDVFWTEIWH